MPSQSLKDKYDVVIVGGGHNGLVAATYLAQADLSVLVLERLDTPGGAAVSASPFAGLPARLSRYSYLVGVLPDQIVADLGLDLELRSRPVASYTPVHRNGAHSGLLVERNEGAATADSFRRLTGSDREYDAWRTFYGEVREFTEALAPTLLEPLRTAREVRDLVDGRTWDYLVEEPLGRVIEERFSDDTVRGVVAADALIGTFADLNDESGVQNRCFLYHLVGNGSGEWRVPVGGMGAVTDALAVAARNAGATIVTGAGVSGIESDGTEATVTWHDGEGWRAASCDWVLSNVAPWVLQVLLGEDAGDRPEGAQLNVNLLLDRLPRLRSGEPPRNAFAGTFHVAEDYTQLQKAYQEAADGGLPTTQPGELSLPLADGPLDPGAAGRAGHAHADLLRGAHPGPGVRRRRRRPARRRGGPGPRRDQRGARGADRVTDRHRRERRALPRGQSPAGHRRGPRDAGRSHLPRRPRLAVGAEPHPARLPRAAVGRRDRAAERAALRVGCAPRWRGQRARRPQRGAGRAGGPGQTLPGSSVTIGGLVGCSDPPAGSTVIATVVPALGIAITLPASRSSSTPADVAVPEWIVHIW